MYITEFLSFGRFNFQPTFESVHISTVLCHSISVADNNILHSMRNQKAINVEHYCEHPRLTFFKVWARYEGYTTDTCTAKYSWDVKKTTSIHTAIQVNGKVLFENIRIIQTLCSHTIAAAVMLSGCSCCYKYTLNSPSKQKMVSVRNSICK